MNLIISVEYNEVKPLMMKNIQKERMALSKEGEFRERYIGFVQQSRRGRRERAGWRSNNAESVSPGFFSSSFERDYGARH